MQTRIISKKFLFIFCIDLLLVWLSFYAANLLRFEFNIPAAHMAAFWRILPLILITKMTAFFFFDLYRGMWRYTSISDFVNIAKSATISTLIVITIILYDNRFEGISRSIFIMDWFFTIFAITGFRLSIRFYFTKFKSDKFGLVFSNTVSSLLHKEKQPARNLLIIGAGDCGEKICRDMLNNSRMSYRVVGFIDDDPDKMGKKIHGIPVLSTVANIGIVALKMKADEALIAIPSANAGQMRRIVSYCKKSRLRFKTIPGTGELMNGNITVNAIREVAYQDLLGREVIKLDEKQIGAYLKDQTVLVTGAGGSIGSELSRQIGKFQPLRIVLLERAESALYEIELDLKSRFSGIEIVSVLGDIQNRKQLVTAFSTHKPNTVFHAAAYKQVPILELQPWKAIENNIIGTSNLVEISQQVGVERFVFVSTDKAVRPANVMGSTKRVAEMLVQNQSTCADSNTRYMIVRFGNVVGSVGSVVPRFKKQIEMGGPVTVTHPDVTRYFMTIPEACQLILQAGAMGKGGEIFLLDMGTSIKIDDMARDLIRLSGLEPDVDIKIEYIGLRPGEKLYEELIVEGENIVPTDHEKIVVLQGLDCNPQILNGNIQKLTELAKHQDREGITKTLKNIVPDYIPNPQISTEKK